MVEITSGQTQREKRNRNIEMHQTEQSVAGGQNLKRGI